MSKGAFGNPLISLGTFEVKSGEVVVCDPCYHREFAANMKLKVKNGTWEAMYEKKNRHGAKYMLASMVGESSKERKWEEADFKAYVDAGKACICDISAFRSNDYVDEDPSIFIDLGHAGDKWHSMVCELVRGNELAAIFPHGFVAVSGVDSGFPVHVRKDKNGEVNGILVPFAKM